MKLVRLEDVERAIKNTLQRYSPDIEYLTGQMDEKEEGEYIMYDAILSSLQSLPTQNEWISVEERLPENGQKVLIFLNPIQELLESDIKDARFFDDKLGTRFRVGAGDFVHGMYVKHKDFIQKDTDDIIYQVSHWMPLPLSPSN